MGLVQTIKFSDFAFDPKIGLKDYSLLHIKNGISLKNILINESIETSIKSGRTPSKFNEDYWKGEYDFFTMQDIDQDTYSLNDISVEQITAYAINNEKTLYLAPKNSLIVSNAMTIGLAFIAQREIYINQNVFHINIDDKKANKNFLKWYFNLIIRPKLLKIFASKYFSKSEFGRLKIPNINLSSQNKAIQKIKPIEKEIQELKSQRKEHLEIINDVFSEEFDYDKNLWKTFGKGMTAGTQKSYDKNLQIYKLKLSQINQSDIFRISSRFYNPLTQELNNILNKYNTIHIKNIVFKYIQRGVSPKYDNDGDVSVIKTAQLKNNYINLSECDFVSTQFLIQKDRAKVLKNDVLIASTGKVSLGKIDINDLDIDLLADGHITILRVDKEKYNPFFLTYFLRSILGTYQIERDYTGATNQIDLYATEIGNFKIPDFILDKQQKIVDNIKTKIDAQKDIENKIKQKQDNISLIIEECIKISGDTNG